MAEPNLLGDIQGVITAEWSPTATAVCDLRPYPEAHAFLHAWGREPTNLAVWHALQDWCMERGLVLNLATTAGLPAWLNSVLPIMGTLGRRRRQRYCKMFRLLLAIWFGVEP